MIGILVELLLSWLLLKYFARENLDALGLKPNGIRVLHLCAGILWPILFVAIYSYSVSLLVHNPYRVNPAFQWSHLRSWIGFLLRSVAYEDLAFRGAVLYVLIRKIGPQKALLISAAAFGIYHWFSYQVLGNPAQMLLVFVMTGMAGYIFALAFERTLSMYLPFGLHFGIDFAKMVLFPSEKHTGVALFFRTYSKDPVSPSAWISVVAILIYFLGFPTLTFLGLRRILRDQTLR